MESEPRSGLVEVGTFWNACDLPHKDLLKTTPKPGRQIVSSPRLWQSQTGACVADFGKLAKISFPVDPVCSVDVSLPFLNRTGTAQAPWPVHTPPI